MADCSDTNIVQRNKNPYISQYFTSFHDFSMHYKGRARTGPRLTLVLYPSFQLYTSSYVLFTVVFTERRENIWHKGDSQ